MKKFIVEKFLLEIDRLDATEVIDEHISECDMGMTNLMHHHFGHDDDKQPEEDGIDKSSFEHHGSSDEDEIDLDKGEDWGSKDLDSDKELNSGGEDNNSSLENDDDITDKDPYEYEDKDDIEKELNEAFTNEAELEEQKLPMMGVANQNNPNAMAAMAAAKRAKEMALKMMAKKK